MARSTPLSESCLRSNFRIRVTEIHLIKGRLHEGCTSQLTAESYANIFLDGRRDLYQIQMRTFSFIISCHLYLLLQCILVMEPFLWGSVDKEGCRLAVNSGQIIRLS